MSKKEDTIAAELLKALKKLLEASWKQEVISNSYADSIFCEEAEALAEAVIAKAEGK